MIAPEQPNSRKLAPLPPPPQPPPFQPPQLQPTAAPQRLQAQLYPAAPSQPPAQLQPPAQQHDQQQLDLLQAEVRRLKASVA